MKSWVLGLQQESGTGTSLLEVALCNEGAIAIAKQKRGARDRERVKAETMSCPVGRGRGMTPISLVA